MKNLNSKVQQYQILEQLGHNWAGGRVTYRGIAPGGEEVVVKQFRFLQGDWGEYKEVEREIEMLQQLNHLSIPRYLDSFDSGEGLCLVQQYVNAQALSYLRSFSPEEIKEIATQLLEILVYLQERIPPVFHRDIKPENVLVDRELKVYLIDFGLARIGEGTLAQSSMMGGTLGFMPPEQLLGRSLTKASDLYGVGATLVCLLTQIKSVEIGSLIDFSTNKINFRHNVPRLSFRFIEWLEKMVQPDPEHRYQSAALALKALEPLDVIRTPKVNLSQSELEFTAASLGQKARQTITVTNPVPETVLQGNWSVAPHPKDPTLATEHSWIQVVPREFEGNEVDCIVQVDTKKLQADSCYRRELVLTSNAEQENICLSLEVETAPIPLKYSLPPWGKIAVAGVFFFSVAGATAQVWLWGGWVAFVMLLALFGAIAEKAEWARAVELLDKFYFEENWMNLMMCALSAVTGICVGAGVVVGFTLYLSAALITCGLSLIAMTIFPIVEARRLKAQYHRTVKNLIKPH